jgi:hypothetical protein
VTQDHRQDMLDIGGNHIYEARKGRGRVDHYEPSWLRLVHGDNVDAKWGDNEPLRNREANRVLERFGINRKEVEKCLEQT